MQIGERIKAYREANNLYQQDLAEQIGVTRQAVSSWEQGRTLPNIGAVERMAMVFKCQKTDLLGDDFQQRSKATTDKEIILIERFRNADERTREMVLRLLKYDEEIKKAINESSKIK